MGAGFSAPPSQKGGQGERGEGDANGLALGRAGSPLEWALVSSSPDQEPGGEAVRCSEKTSLPLRMRAFLEAFAE